MIDLNFLGCGAAFFPKLGNTNAYFVKDNRIFFLDFGESAFEKVYSHLHAESYTDIYVLISHLHADHVGSLASFISYMYFVHSKTIHVIHPSEQILNLLALQGIARDAYLHMTALPAESGVSVRFVPVEHANDMRCFGYVLSDGDSRIYFSGDASTVPPEILSEFLGGKIERIYQDTASHKSASHCYYKDLMTLIPENNRKNVFCMHFDGDYVQLLKEAHFSVVKSNF